MQLSSFLTFSSNFAMTYKYLLVFAGAFIEGPILMIACGFLYRLGVFNLIYLYFALMAGDLLADVFWYYVGYFFAKPFLKKFGRFFGLNEERLEKAHTLFHTYKNGILLISKVTIGFGMALAIVVFAGVVKIPMRIYIALNTLGEIFMVAGLLAIGYFAGHFYVNISDSYKTFTLVVTAVVILALLYGFSGFVREMIFKKTK